MTNSDALAGVVARVTWLADRLYGLPGEKQLLKLTPRGAESYACDLRTLLAALAEAREDSERLARALEAQREALEYVGNIEDIADMTGMPEDADRAAAARTVHDIFADAIWPLTPPAGDTGMSDAQKPTSVQEARATLEQEIYDEMSGGVPGRDVRWPDALDTLIAAVRAEEQARVRQVANDVVDSHEYSEQDCWRHGYPSKQSERMAERFTDGLRAGVARVLAAFTNGGAA